MVFRVSCVPPVFRTVLGSPSPSLPLSLSVPLSPPLPLLYLKGKKKRIACLKEAMFPMPVYCRKKQNPNGRKNKFHFTVLKDALGRGSANVMVDASNAYADLRRQSRI